MNEDEDVEVVFGMIKDDLTPLINYYFIRWPLLTFLSLAEDENVFDTAQGQGGNVSFGDFSYNPAPVRHLLVRGGRK